ncbi:MAG: hypothetical protein IPN68_00375 [Bacteroidetes bacterium]|nr:hypothetical protein [Bacteroidota bacterium]
MKPVNPYRNLYPDIIIIFLIIVLPFFPGCNNNQGRSYDSSANKVSPVKSATNAAERKSELPVSDVSADSLQELLKGKWLRSDGTYIIEIFSIKSDGVMDAGYFNPNPINVGKSGWLIRDGEIVYEIILKDINYPGSKYNLIYDKKNDCLIGNYFQAVQGINYDVVFIRQK